MMAFEYGHYMRVTLSTWGFDQQYCFDRIWPEVSNNVALANGSEPANSKQQTANSKQQTANSKQQTANSKQRTVNSKT